MLQGHSTNRLTFRMRFLIFNHMVELQAPQLDSVFHALGDATRRQMLRDLASGERTVGQLAQPFAISLGAPSNHTKPPATPTPIPPYLSSPPPPLRPPPHPPAI